MNNQKGFTFIDTLLWIVGTASALVSTYLLNKIFNFPMAGLIGMGIVLVLFLTFGMTVITALIRDFVDTKIAKPKEDSDKFSIWEVYLHLAILIIVPLIIGLLVCYK